MILSKEEIGKRLKSLRADRKINDLANVCGVSRQMYWNYETGKATPSDNVKSRLANFYSTSVDAIFFAKEFTACKQDKE